MAFKIKDNLDLYGNQLLNFALQSDSGFPQSPQVGHMFNYTGTGVMANHAVMCVDETTKAFKALAFVDEIASNTAFKELADRVDDLEAALGTDEKDVLDTWEEVKTFLASIKESDGDLMTMLNGKLNKSGGTITYEGDSGLRLSSTNLYSNYLWFEGIVNGSKLNLGALGMRGYNNPAYVSPTGFAYGILHEDNYSNLIGDYYLKSSGGTIKNQDINILTINRNGGGSVSSIAFKYNDEVLYGYLGFDAVNNPVWIDSAHNRFSLIHSGNIGEYKAGGLQTSAGKTYVSFVDNENESYAYAKINGVGIGFNGNTIEAIGTNGPLYIQRNVTQNTIINQYGGNVLVGTTDDSGAKLYVSGDARFDGQTRINGSMRFYGKSGLSSDIYLNNQSVGGLLFTYSDKEPLLFVGSNIGIGTSNPQKKLHVVGDLYVDGNIIATKEVSAGGAGQEGESGDGGAEVLAQQLAKGQSTYTITNTIKRSDIAVSLYEANVINGQTIWSLCLADIEVTNSTITVTFGSATSVNHKLVAVG